MSPCLPSSLLLQSLLVLSSSSFSLALVLSLLGWGPPCHSPHPHPDLSLSSLTVHSSEGPLPLTARLLGLLLSPHLCPSLQVVFLFSSELQPVLQVVASFLPLHFFDPEEGNFEPWKGMAYESKSGEIRKSKGLFFISFCPHHS